MKTVAIIGVGLMGGSLGLKLKSLKGYRVIGLGSRLESLQNAKRLRAIDDYSLDESILSQADIVVIASPVAHIVPTLKRILSHLKPGTLVMDVGSVKASILRAAAQMRWPSGLSFVGVHPMAGSHKVGVDAAFEDLYQNATCVLVPLHGSAMARAKTFWKQVGGNPIVMSAQQHDEAVAVTSHLPHLIAHALVHTLVTSKNRKQMMPLLAGSFRDVTRVASSDPHQWQSIFENNRQALTDAQRRFTKELQRLSQSIGSKALLPALQKSHKFRKPLFEG